MYPEIGKEGVDSLACDRSHINFSHFFFQYKASLIVSILEAYVTCFECDYLKLDLDMISNLIQKWIILIMGDSFSGTCILEGEQELEKGRLFYISRA